MVLKVLQAQWARRVQRDETEMMVPRVRPVQLVPRVQRDETGTKVLKVPQVLQVPSVLRARRDVMGMMVRRVSMSTPLRLMLMAN